MHSTEDPVQSKRKNERTTPFHGRGTVFNPCLGNEDSTNWATWSKNKKGCKVSQEQKRATAGKREWDEWMLTLLAFVWGMYTHAYTITVSHGEWGVLWFGHYTAKMCLLGQDKMLYMWPKSLLGCQAQECGGEVWSSGRMPHVSRRTSYRRINFLCPPADQSQRFVRRETKGKWVFIDGKIIKLNVSTSYFKNSHEINRNVKVVGTHPGDELKRDNPVFLEGVHVMVLNVIISVWDFQTFRVPQNLWNNTKTYVSLRIL